MGKRGRAAAEATASESLESSAAAASSPPRRRAAGSAPKPSAWLLRSPAHTHSHAHTETNTETHTDTRIPIIRRSEAQRLCDASIVSLPHTLANGQCFNWRQLSVVIADDDSPHTGHTHTHTHTHTRVEAHTHVDTLARTGAHVEAGMHTLVEVRASATSRATPRAAGGCPITAWRGVLGTYIITLFHLDDAIMFAVAGTDVQPETGGASSVPTESAAGHAQTRTDGRADAETHAHAGGTTSNTMQGARELLVDYFQLNIDMAPLYAAWGRADERMAAILPHMPAMRFLRQPPVECLFSFICSSNNNIPRIAQMVDSLRKRYGKSIGTIDGMTYHAFPEVAVLAAASETDLRALGLGYRAKFVRETATALEARGGANWLVSLRTSERASVREHLCEFCGVGPKVADCVALFSLDQADAIPVDTHVWAIASRYYDRSLTSVKSLTPSVYQQVGDIFRFKFGDRAGWAHSLLFAAELPSFRDALPEAMRQEMVALREAEKATKAEARAAAAQWRAAGKEAASETAASTPRKRAR